MVIYDTIGDETHDPPLKSFIIITEADGVTPIDPNGEGVYTDIPAGARIRLGYVFSLSDGEEGQSDFYEYSEGDYFTIALPEGLEFDCDCAEGTIVAEDSVSGDDYDLADWTIAGSELKVVLTEEGAGEEHQGRWGRIELSGSFKPLAAGDDTETRVVFGSETIIIRREPLPMESTLAKEGSYNAGTGEITWRVTVTPPAGDPGLSYGGYTVIDTFGDNQSYVDGSFTVKNGNEDEGDVADEELSFSSDSTEGLTTISYTFPAATGGVQVITFKTKPDSFAGADGASEFENTVNLERNAGEPAAEPQGDRVTLDWIDKAGRATRESDEDPDIVKWTVTVKVPGEGGSLTGAKIIDQLHEDLELFVDGNHPVQIKFGTGSAVDVLKEDDTDENGYYIYDANEHTLTYYFPGGNQPTAGTEAVLTFYTRVDSEKRDGFLNHNEEINFTNRATLSWEESQDLEKSPSTVYTTGSGQGSGPGIGAGGLISKSADGSGNYKYEETDIIGWTITVNRNRVTMTGATVTDVIPASQELLIDEEHPFTVEKAGGNLLFETKEAGSSGGTGCEFTYTGENNFSFQFTGSIADSYTITYYTRITDRSSLYANGTVGFNNTAILSRTGVADVSANGTKSFSSQMLYKGIADAYDYTSHLIQWQIVVNRNRLPLTGAAVSDTLPDGMTLFIDEDHPFEITSITSSGGGGADHDAEHGEEEFTVTLPDGTTDQYTIKFWTKLSEDVLKVKWNDSKTFKNEAELKAGEVDSVTADATANIKNPVITKTGEQGNDWGDRSSDTIYWSVILNNAQLDLADAVVSDTLHEALQLDPDSVKLYEISINPATGAHDPAVEPIPVDLAGSVSYEGNILTVSLPDGPQAYLLEFSTWILDDQVVSLTNTVELSGGSGSPSGSDTTRNISVREIYSTGGSGSNKLTVVKTDMGDEPLAGAQFRLLNVNQQPVMRGGQEIIRITDAQGIAVFENLPAWLFYVEEIEPPPGYLIPADPIFYGERLSGEETITIGNTKALGDISFMKVDYTNNERLLSGGRFELSGIDYEGGAVLMTAVSENGIVTFRGVPIDDGQGYLIREVSPPRGYRLTDAVLEASVQYNDDKTGVVARLSEEILTNRRGSGGGGGGDDPGEDPEDPEDPKGPKDPEDPEDPDSMELDKDPGGTGGNLPKTGGIAPSLYMLLAGLVLVILGLVFARNRHRAGH